MDPSPLEHIGEAISEIRRAQELDPLSPLLQSIGSEVLYYARRYDAAAEHARKALFLDPNFRLACSWLANTSAQKGMYQEALKQCKEAERLTRGERRLLASVAYVYAVAGNRGQALTLVGQASGEKSPGEIPSTFVARIYVALGEKERALEWLEKAYEERDPYMVFLNVGPQWDTLRLNPRFQHLLRRMKFG